MVWGGFPWCSMRSWDISSSLLLWSRRVPLVAFSGGYLHYIVRRWAEFARFDGGPDARMQAGRARSTSAIAIYHGFGATHCWGLLQALRGSTLGLPAVLTRWGFLGEAIFTIVIQGVEFRLSRYVLGFLELSYFIFLVTYHTLVLLALSKLRVFQFTVSCSYTYCLLSPFLLVGSSFLWEYDLPWSLGLPFFHDSRL